VKNSQRAVENPSGKACGVVKATSRLRGCGLRPRLALSALFCALAAGQAFAIEVDALPSGASIAAGTASIAQSGATMRIDQATQNLVVNWNRFDIGAAAYVHFSQPNAAAIALNRVLSGDASQIFGRLSADGKVFLINPSGILFGAGARVDVGGLVASTLDISDADFLSGRLVFGNGSSGSVVNRGEIRAADHGYVVLLAPEVRNEGVIVARLGTVVLAAGNRVSLDTGGDGLVKVSVDEAALNALAANQGLIRADGGLVYLGAKGAGDVMATVVNNAGVIEARGLIEREGRILLVGGEDAGVVANSGTLDASSATGKGGGVRVLGDKVGLFDGTRIDASGASGGGEVLIGGDFQGGNAEVQNATHTYVGRDVRIKADAGVAGDGGKVIVWADDVTRYYGGISVRGGAQGGDGGFVEVSGKGDLVYRGQVSLGAPLGHGGTLLLDPTNIVIQAGAGDLDGELNGSADPTIAFADGGANTILGVAELTSGFASGDTLLLQASNDITVGTAVALQSGVNLELAASRNIGINAAVTASGTGNVKLTAGGAITDGNAGGPDVTAARLDATAGTGIDLDTRVATLKTSNQTSGDTLIRNTGDLVVVGMNNATAGRITLTNTGSIQIGDGTGGVNPVINGYAGASITASGPTAYVTLLGPAQDLGALNPPSIEAIRSINGPILVHADRDIVLGAAPNSTATHIYTGAGPGLDHSITLEAGGDVTLDNASRVTSDVGAIAATAGRNINFINTVWAGATISSGNTTAGGGITLRAGQNIDMAAQTFVQAQKGDAIEMTATAGHVTVFRVLSGVSTANPLGTVAITAGTYIDNTATTGNTTANVIGTVVTLRADSGGIGQSNGALDVNALTRLDAFTTADGAAIAIDDVTGAFPVGSIDARKDAATLGNVTLTAAGAITQGTGSGITGNVLTVDAVTGVALTTTVASITTADGLTVSGTGAVNITETDAVTLTNITTNDGAITVSAGGDMTATNVVAGGAARNVSLTMTAAGNLAIGTVTASGDTVTLNSAGNITQVAALARVTAANLFIDAGGAIGTAPNPLLTTVSTIAEGADGDTLNAVGDVYITNTGALTITHLETAGNITLIDTSTVNSTTVDGTADLVGATLNITATAIGTNAANPLEINATTLNTNTVAAGGNQFILDTAGGVAVGLMDAGAGNITLTATGGMINSATPDGTADVVGVTIALNAATGIGLSGALDVTGTSISAASTNGNIDIDSLTTGAVTATSLTTGTGNIQFDQTGGQTLGVTLAQTTSGDITLTNASATLTATTVTAGGADGDIQLTTTTAGNVIITAATGATGSVSVDSVGQILDGGVGSISSPTLDLAAGTGIGTSATPLTLVGGTISLNANTTTGGVFLSNTPAGTVIIGGAGISTADASNIYYSQTGQNLTINAAISTLGGNITLDPPDNIAINAVISTGTGAADAVAAGNISIIANTSIAFNAGGQANATDVDGNGNVTLLATAGAITTDGAAPVDVLGNVLTVDAVTGAALTTTVASITTADGLTVSGTGAVNITETDAVTLTNITTNDGAITVSAGGDMTATNVVAGGAARNVSLTMTAAGNLAIGTVTASGDTVTLNSAGNITQVAALARVTAANLFIDAGGAIGTAPNPLLTTVSTIAEGADGDTLNAVGDVYITNTGALTITHLETAGNITLIDTSTVNSTTVDGTADLVGATLNITATAIGTNAANPLEINATTLNTNTVAAGGNQFILDTAGGVAVGLMDAGAGNITLTANNGAITSEGSDAGTADIVAATVNLAVVETAVAANTIGTAGAALEVDATTLNATTALGVGDNINLTDTASGVAIGLVTAGAGNVTLTATGGMINSATPDGTADAVGATITLNAGSGIGLTGALDIIGTSVSAVSTNGNIDIDSLVVAGVTATNLSTGTGNIRFDQTGGQTLAVTLATTTDGDITITNDNANLTATTVTAGGTDGNVVLTTTTSGDVLVDTVTGSGATGSVIINSVGAIQNADNDVGADILATTIDLNAVTGIGTGANLALDVTGTTISADTTDGNVDIDSLATGAVAVSSLSTGTGNIQFDQTGGQTLGVTLAQTTSGDITLTNASATLTATTVTAGGADGDIQLTTTTAGNVIITAATGATGSVSVDSVGQILDGGVGSISSPTLDLAAGTGIGTSATPLTLVGGTISLNANTTTGGVFLSNTPAGTVIIGGAGISTADASNIYYSQTGQNLTINAAISTLGGNITLDPPDNIAINAAIDSGGGDVLVEATNNLNVNAGGSISSGNGTITLTADFGNNGAGDFTQAALAGAINAGSGLVTLRGVNAQIANVQTTGNAGITATGGNITEDGDAGVDIVANALTLTATGGIGAAEAIDTATAVLTARTTTAGAIRLSNTGAVSLAANAIGGLVDVENSGGTLAVAAGGVSSSNGTVNLRNAAANITLNGVVSGNAAGDTVTLSTGANFINNAGAGAVVVAAGGRWLIYSASPLTDTFGGLNSGNVALWGATYPSTPPAGSIATGNRYLFAYQPTVIFRGGTLGKLQGADANAALALYLTGWRDDATSYYGGNGAGSAFTQDTRDNAFTSAPTVTSTGADVAAAAGTYAIVLAKGGLVSTNGNAMAFVDGTLTVLGGSAVYDYNQTLAFLDTEFTAGGLRLAPLHEDCRCFATPLGEQLCRSYAWALLDESYPDCPVGTLESLVDVIDSGIRLPEGVGGR